MMRRSTQQIAAATILALLLTASAGGQVIHLRATAAVAAPVVRLGDVAEIVTDDPDRAEALAGVLLSRAPLDGQESRVDIERVSERLGRLGYDLSAMLLSGNRSCIVTRAAAAPVAQPGPEANLAVPETIPPSQRRTLGAALRQFLTERAGPSAGELRIEFAATDRMLLQLTETVGRFEISARGGRTLGEVPLAIEVPTAEGNPHRLRITASVYLVQVQVVARRALAKGAVLAAEDVQCREALVTRVEGRVARTVDEVVGAATSDALEAGEPIRTDRIERPALIHRGDAVTVTWQRGALRIKTVAYAAADAALGERVQLSLDHRGKDAFIAVCSGPHAARIDADSAAVRPGDRDTTAEGRNG
jgi:flagella basal body P-ring formation protein FlgA